MLPPPNGIPAPQEARRVLIVDDSAEDRESVRRYLKQDCTCAYTFTEENTVETGLKAALTQMPDCVVLDYSLTDGTGLRFLEKLRAALPDQLLAVVMLTGTGDEMIAVQAMKYGAQDYLIKGKSSAESLRLAVRNAIYKASTEVVLAQQRQELERLYRAAQEANRRKDDLVRELQRARDQAESANQAKDRFLAALSHELRTPLTPVLSTVSSMLSEADSTPAEVRRALEMIRRNVGLEARLIDDLLDLTRIVQGKLTLDLARVDLHACVREAIEICEADYRAKRVTLRSQLLATLTTVEADSARLQQVLWNLLKNAVKFTPTEGLVSIETENEGSEVVLRVIDTGAGISSEHLPNIFNAFEQGDSEQARRAGGLGLGLAISKALAEAHGGRLLAESPGVAQGAAFTLRLPALAGGATALPRASGAEMHAPAGAAKRLLLVEDHSDSAAALSRALSRRGYQIQHAESVAQALQVCAAEKFDLLICDIGLPDGTGLELLERLRQTHPVKAIALSGFGMDHDLQRSRNAGFVAHLIKPIDFQKLLLVIEEALGSKTAPA